MKKLLLTLLACALAAPSAFAASPWDGTYKLDRSKSHFTGGSFTFSKTADGMWHVKFGTLKYDFAPDGKPYNVLDADHTVMVTMPDDHTMKTVNQFKGKTQSSSVDTLSADGKTFSDATTGTHEDGTAYNSTETDKCVGACKGFLGTWVSTKESNDTRGVSVITTNSDGTVTFADPVGKYSLTVKLDGTPATPTAPDMTAGITVSDKKVSAHRIDYSVMLKDKKIVGGYFLLAADGKSYKDVSWLVGSESEITTAVYVKQ